jgi:hypothetical protein
VIARVVLTSVAATLIVTGTGVINALPAAAAPVLSHVNVQLVQPSTLALDRGHPMNVQLVSGNIAICEYQIWRLDDLQTRTYLGDYVVPSRMRVTYRDYLVGTDTNTLQQYEARRKDCNGNWGDLADSIQFWPGVGDDDVYSVVSGSRSRVYSDSDFGGSHLQLSGIGGHSRYRLHSIDGYNVGVVGMTGPKGGIATVYVHGVKKARINFYSSTVHRRQMLFKMGSSTPIYPVIDIVTTAKGAAGGAQQYLDAVELNSNG